MDWEQAARTRRPAAQTAVRREVELDRPLTQRALYGDTMADSSDGTGGDYGFALAGSGPKVRATSIFCIRVTSLVWSALMSFASLKVSWSCAAP